MATFSFGEHLTKSEYIVSAKLGATNAKFTDADVGKPVKLAADSRFDLCADGDLIDGFCTSVEDFLVQGSTFGGVQMGGFKEVTVTGPVAIGDYVVAAGTTKLKKMPAFTANDATTVKPQRWRYVSGEVNAGAVDCKGVVMFVG